MYAAPRGQSLQYGSQTLGGSPQLPGATSSQGSPQLGSSSRGQGATVSAGGLLRKSLPFNATSTPTSASTSAVKLSGPPTNSAPTTLESRPRPLSRGAGVASTAPAAAGQRTHSRGLVSGGGGGAIPPSRLRGNSASSAARASGPQGRSAVYSAGGASSNSSGPATTSRRTPSGVSQSAVVLQQQPPNSPTSAPHSPSLGSAPDRTAQLSQRCPSTSSRNDWRTPARVPSQQSSASRSAGYPSAASKKQMPATPTMNNHRAPLDNQRTPAASSQGLRHGVSRQVGSPALSAPRLRSPSDSRSGISGGDVRQNGLSGTPMTGRSPKAGSPGRRNHLVASEPNFEASGNAGQQRGGPIMEESNVILRVEEKRVAEDAQPTAKAPGPHQPNYISRFFAEVPANLLQPRMDVAQYWEKRRVQNVLRRVLEAVQEKFSPDGEIEAKEFDNVFDYLVQCLPPRQPAVAQQNQDVLLEADFIAALEKLSIWPPELSAEDRSEIFHALRVPSVAAVRTAVREKHQFRSISRWQFREGFENVPFNLPDFPVPTHLMTQYLTQPLEKFTNDQKTQVTEAVATTFCLAKTGLDKVKDFFICGLLSLEEVQMRLPRLLPTAVVQDAIVRVIRLGAPLMTAEEWHNFVLGVRTPQACGQPSADEIMVEEVETTASPSREAAPLLPNRNAADAMHAQHASEEEYMPSTPSTQAREELSHAATHALNGQVSLQSPKGEQRDMRGPNAQCHRDLDRSAIEGDQRAPTDIEPEGAMNRFRGRFEPVTEPLPCRNIRNEETGGVDFYGFAGGHPVQRERVVNWFTAVSSPDRGSSGSGHQADEGAGNRLTWGTSVFKAQELAAAAASKTSNAEPPVVMPGGADPVAWINLELHHECGGPYLAAAFVRCCELYTERKRGAAS